MGFTGVGWNFGIGGGGEVEVAPEHTSDVVLTLSDFGKIHVLNSSSKITVTIPVLTSAFVNKFIWFKKKGTGAVDINMSGTDTCEGENDIENTTTEQFAMIGLACDEVGKLSLYTTPLGSWQ